MKSMHRGVSRRNLLKGAGLIGMTSGLPMLIAACGGGEKSASSAGPWSDAAPREIRTLHFDLSHGLVEAPYLSLHNSQHHRRRLMQHDSDSRARHRTSNAILRQIPDEKLTHYLEDVDLPAKALQLGSVWGQHPDTSQVILAVHFVHVPKSSLEALEKRRKARGQTPRDLSAKLRGYGVSQAALDSSPIESQIGPLSGPADVATALIFQHPAITNLDPDLGADILDRIANLPCADNDYTCDPYSDPIATQIALLIGASNYPSTTSTGSWATLQTIVDPTTGSALINEDGELVYTFQINAVVQQTLAPAIKAILNDINNDALFMGTNWQSRAGGVSAQVTPTAVSAAVRTLLGANDFSVVPSVPIGVRKSGVRLLDVQCDDNRNVVFTVLNEYLRSSGVYVQYFDSTGASIPNKTPTAYDDGDAYYNSIISPQVNVMGIPLQAGLGAVTTNFRFTMPDDAVTARVSYGGLGLGGSDAFSKKALIGTILTIVLNIGLPTIFLVQGIAVTYNQGIKDAFFKALEDPVTLTNILTIVGKSLLGGSLQGGVQSSATNLSIAPFLAGAGATILQIFLASCPQLAVLLAVAAGTSKFAEAVPFVGFAMMALSTLADLATIAETLIECVTCPAIVNTDVALTMGSSVVISRDPRDFQFPATARNITVKAFYDGGTTPIVAYGMVSPGQVDPLTIALNTTSSSGALQGVKSGGLVRVEVFLYSASGCLVGQGATQSIANLPQTAASIPVTITELLVPLDATTTYQHQSKLAYVGGAHIWQTSAPAPVLTRANLCQGNDGSICALHGLTVHTASGMAAYGFNAGNQGISLCGGTAAASLNTIRNIFLGNNPDSGRKLASCGETQPIGIAYSPAGAITGGENFFLQQDLTANIYHLRSVDLAAGASFDMAQTLTWGAFTNPLDSLCVMSSGHVVGVNRSTHRMEVIQLPMQPSSSTDERRSATFPALVGGYGSAVGKLNTPVAVASVDGAVLILEQGNQRVQAFDADGNTIARFTDSTGSKTPLMSLGTDTGVTYLDIAVEGAGYVYVLSYVSSGTSPSNYRLDLYDPNGEFLSRTASVTAGNIAVDLFRNLYTLNYETVSGSPTTEPSLSQWEPNSTTPCAGSASAVTLSAPRFAATCGVPAANFH